MSVLFDVSLCGCCFIMCMFLLCSRALVFGVCFVRECCGVPRVLYLCVSGSFMCVLSFLVCFFVMDRGCCRVSGSLSSSGLACLVPCMLLCFFLCLHVLCLSVVLCLCLSLCLCVHELSFRVFGFLFRFMSCLPLYVSCAS